MTDLFPAASPYLAWLALGLLLAVGEMAVPGVFLIWLAIAALITGALVWLVPISLPVQIVVFVMLALVSVFVGRNYLARNPIKPADPLLNHRGQQAVGQIVTVTETITQGSGRVKLGDSEWLAQGAEAPVGATMVVTGINGGTLLVEHHT